MSFELSIATPARPRDLRIAWQNEFAKNGLEVEIYPNFNADSWAGGFLPFRVLAASPDLIGFTLQRPALSGFEIDFHPEGALPEQPRQNFTPNAPDPMLRTAAGRTTTEFALQCIGGATLALICDGHYVDDQNGIVCPGSEALEAALSEIHAFVASAEAREKISHDFPGWEALATGSR